jgi:hypothetical protein
MFTHFCRDVYQSSPSSLRIVVILGQVTLEQLLELQEVEKENIKDLELFRKLKHFETTDAKRSDAPTGFSIEGFSTIANLTSWFVLVWKATGKIPQVDHFSRLKALSLI